MIRMWPSEEWASRIYDVANIALIVGLVIGVVATFLIVWMGNVKEAYLRKQVGDNLAVAALAQKDATGANLKIAELGKEAADAKLKSAAFERDIATANQKAAEANRIAEGERLARTKIEETLAGWKLPPDARMRLLEKLKPYANTPFDLSVNPTEVRFMESMDTALSGAGWLRQEPKAPPAPPGSHGIVMLISGKAAINVLRGTVRIEASPELRKQHGDAAQALANGLAAEGISVGLFEMPNHHDPSAIHIVIGARE